MSLAGDKYLFVALVILLGTLRCSCGTQETSAFDLQVTSRKTGESISDKMLQIRHLLKSLFLNWNFGESNLEGPAERTFGRIRIMRKIMLPLAFIGGFMTAVIFSIKFTGLINMLLIKKVLLLQMALILGKLIYGAKELFTAKYQSSPSFYPVYFPSHSEDHHHHGSFSHKTAYLSLPDDDFNPQPSYYSQQSHAFDSQPQFNQRTSYPLSFNQPQPNIQSQWKFGQTGSFDGIPLQVPQNIQFNQPLNQGHASFAEPQNYESRFNNNVMLQAQSLIGSAQSTIKSLSPQEMTKLLSDAIMQVSSRTKPSPVNRRTDFNYRSSKRK